MPNPDGTFTLVKLIWDGIEGDIIKGGSLTFGAAGLGAAIGSIFPIVGTAIGGAIGAAVGATVGAAIVKRNGYYTDSEDPVRLHGEKLIETDRDHFRAASAVLAESNPA